MAVQNADNPVDNRFWSVSNHMYECTNELFRLF